MLDPLRHMHIPGFGGVIFRRTNADIRKEGGTFASARALYTKIGATARESTLDFTFPNGNMISLDGLQHELDVENYQSSQICYIAWDEATHFEGSQFWYMISRNRSGCGVRPYIRLGFNPDPDSFVFELFAPWVDEEHPLYPTEPGTILHFLRDEDGKMEWFHEPVQFSKSISYFPATVYDNQILLSKDPGYLANLHNLSGVDKQRLLHGTWKTFQKAGALWRREMFAQSGFRLPPAIGTNSKGQLVVDIPHDVVRVVVALDPSVSDPAKAKNPNKLPDECGIIVAGVTSDARGVILADFTNVMSPASWAAMAVKLYALFGASVIVAEANQGGELIREVIRGVASNVPVQLVHASMGKRPRAEPVAALYENGRMSHCGKLEKLESQMCLWDASNPSAKSPGRVDSASWAMHALGLCDITGMQGTTRLRVNR